MIEEKNSLPIIDNIEIINNLNNDILNILGQLDYFPFVFTGGTALSKYYYEHRHSYDLDFFYENTNSVIKDFDYSDLFDLLIKNNYEIFEIIEIGEGNDYVLELMRIHIFNKEYANIPIKIEFVQDTFAGIFDCKILDNNIKLDKIETIYIRKLYTILSKKEDRIKDYIDLFEIDKKYKPIEEFINFFFEVLKHNIGEVKNAKIIQEAFDFMCKKIDKRQDYILKWFETYNTKYNFNELNNWIINKKNLL